MAYGSSHYSSAIVIGAVLSVIIDVISNKWKTRKMKSNNTISHEHIMECIGFQSDIEAKD